jgi:hypothetical protein
VPGNRPGRDPRPVTSPVDGLRGIGTVVLVAVLVLAIAVLAAVLMLWALGVEGG